MQTKIIRIVLKIGDYEIKELSRDSIPKKVKKDLINYKNLTNYTF